MEKLKTIGQIFKGLVVGILAIAVLLAWAFTPLIQPIGELGALLLWIGSLGCLLLRANHRLFWTGMTIGSWGSPLVAACLFLR